MNVQHTARGFELIEFEDRIRSKVLVAAEQVRELIARLQRWVDHDTFQMETQLVAEGLST